ncbi:MAG: PPC domain-containing DNA-binding protein [Candidatus Sericytochromatia bacterium]|nr:PPC domain-containing DNA-binding protein [Candidatus Sericytochromatia bacterium]
MTLEAGHLATFSFFRLLPGEDLRSALLERAKELPAAFVATCVGSLVYATLRQAGADKGVRREGPFEIVSLVGTLERTGGHLHVALADDRGQLWGGHLLEGSAIHTTAEVVLGVPRGVQFLRRFDPRSGYDELVVLREEQA